MLNRNDDNIEDNFESIDYEFSYIPYDDFTRERPPFIPGGNFPPGNFPNQGNYPGGGGGFTPPGMPQSPPPNYIPSKKDNGVQNFNKSSGGPETLAVSQNSIKFCLFKFTYIWEVNGRSYWTFLFNVDRRSISGFRWLGRNWVYFGLDLRRIDSFVCYRSNSVDECEDCGNLRYSKVSLSKSKKEYSLNGTRDVYVATLASLNIPEVKEDFIAQTIGYVDGNKVKSEIPCVKARNIGYRITLELSYPSNYDKNIKNQINEFANEASNDAYRLISTNKNNEYYSNPLEIFNSSITLIPEVLKTFSDCFNSKLKVLNKSSDDYSNIIYSIREETINDDWKSYCYKDTLF